MFTVRVGKGIMARRHNFTGKVLQFMLVLVLLVLLITLVLQKSSSPFKDIKEDLRRALYAGSDVSKKPSKDGPCGVQTNCPEDNFSFYIRSGAANVIPPKICLQNNVLLGHPLNNAGVGINIVVLNGKTGDVLKTGNFDMYAGEVKPLIEFLKSIESGSVVLMASFDEPSNRLNEEARKLIVELGSSSVSSLAFRDNWVFVGGKGASVKSNFEKCLKNDAAKNKYQTWPELIELQGCIPRYLE